MSDEIAGKPPSILGKSRDYQLREVVEELQSALVSDRVGQECECKFGVSFGTRAPVELSVDATTEVAAATKSVAAVW